MRDLGLCLGLRGRRALLRRQRHDAYLDSVSRLENRHLLSGGLSRSRRRSWRRWRDAVRERAERLSRELPGPAAPEQEGLRELERVSPERLAVS